MLYDDGNHGAPRPFQPQQLPYARPVAPPQMPGMGRGGMGQGSYADYYNGMGGNFTPQRDNYRDLMRLPYNLGRAKMLQQGYTPYGDQGANFAYGPAPQQDLQQPPPVRYGNAPPRSMTGGQGMSYRRQPTYGQFDINGRPPGAWDYQQPQQQAFTPRGLY